MRRDLAGDYLVFGYLLALFALRLLQAATPAIAFLGAWHADLGMAGSWCAAAAIAFVSWPPLIRTMSQSLTVPPWAGYGGWTDAESDTYFTTGRGRNIRCPCPVADS